VTKYSPSAEQPVYFSTPVDGLLTRLASQWPTIPYELSGGFSQRPLAVANLHRLRSAPPASLAGHLQHATFLTSSRARGQMPSTVVVDNFRASTSPKSVLALLNTNFFRSRGLDDSVLISGYGLPLIAIEESPAGSAADTSLDLLDYALLSGTRDFPFRAMVLRLCRHPLSLLAADPTTKYSSSAESIVAAAQIALQVGSLKIYEIYLGVHSQLRTLS